MTRRGDPKSSSAGRSCDDFRKIDGVGVFEQRLWDAGISRIKIWRGERQQKSLLSWHP